MLFRSGQNNAPTTFLTTEPPPGYGVTTNEVKSGLDFSFPNGSDHWITLDKNAGTDEFTIVFATTPISAPAFFNEPSAHALTSDEQKQWGDFLAQFKANAVATEVIKTGAAPFVSVKVPQNSTGSPVIFMVRVEHK